MILFGAFGLRFLARMELPRPQSGRELAMGMPLGEALRVHASRAAAGDNRVMVAAEAAPIVIVPILMTPQQMPLNSVEI